MTVKEWKAHVERLEAELRKLESAPKLAEAKLTVARLEAETKAAPAVGTTWHTRTADLNAAMAARN